MSNSYENPFVTAAEADAEDRQTFIRRTYLHLAIAILSFVMIEAIMLQLPVTERLIGLMLSGHGWLITLGAFIGVSWLADTWARSNASRAMQYAGLSLYVVAESVIFLPLLYMAAYRTGDPALIPMAGIITGLLFVGLTATAFMSGVDFSFLRGALILGGFVALGVVLCSLIFGFSLGMVFSAAMILLAGGSILHTTSNIIHHYRTDQYVAASLSLFAGVMLLLWYVLRILMSARK
jgi:FtsH-binding integral membrane protein